MKKYILISFAVLWGTIIIAQVPQIERDALMALYNSTDGANWVENDNWGTSNPVSTWFGIDVESIAGTEHVTKVSMEFNNLVGTIPPELGNLSEIYKLSFWRNQLTGNIPAELGNCTKMKIISLEQNRLTGPIPLEFANWTQLEVLALNNNNLSGDVTDIYASFPNLLILNLYFLPSLTGHLDLSNCSNLIGYEGIVNGISSIDIRNGNNANVVSFNATSNTNLFCIFVDDKNNIPLGWQKDNRATYVETQAECDALGVEESNTISFDIYPNPTKEFFIVNSKSTIQNVSVYDIFGKLLKKANMTFLDFQKVFT